MSILKRITLLLLCVVMLSSIILTSCGDGSTTNAGTPAVGAAGISLNATSLTLAVGDSYTLVATVSPDDATDKSVTWSSSDTSIVEVTTGVILATGVGIAKITATTANGMSKTCTVTVEKAVVEKAVVEATHVVLNKSIINLTIGETSTLVASVSPYNTTDRSLVWYSSDPSVAKVKNGIVTAAGAGTATITAETTNGKTADCTVKVTEATVRPTGITLNKSMITLYGGETSTLVATVAPSDAADKSVTWSSSNTSVATVNNGVVTAVGVGTATITVITSNGKTATCTVTVENATVEATGVTLDNTALSLNIGETSTLVATVAPSDAADKSVTWSSSNTSVATVNNGVVTAVGAGTATITVITSNGKTATCSVTINRNAVIQYERSGGFYIVTGIEGTTDKLEIPFLYDGLRVKAIKANAFYGNADLKEVILPNSIEFIYENAFMDCSNLEKINLPESLMLIGESAFENCISLKEITIPSLIETVSKKAFYNCTGLESATICEGVKYIGVSTFAKCSALETVTVGSGLETISDAAFDSCTSLKCFEMPNTVKYLGDFAFRYAESLESVTFSTSLTAIGVGCFQSCISLDNVELHDGIVSFGESCFSWCSGMKTLRILGDITLLGNSSFYECSGLENVYYASSTSGDIGINNYVFYNAGINGNGIVFTISANAYIPDRLFEPQVDKNRPKLVKLVVEDGATKVDYFNIYNTLPYLSEIVLPDTITDIKNGCFDNTLWWNNQANGAVYIGNIFYGYKGSMTGELEISNDTVCIAMGALEEQKLTSLTTPFVGSYLGYIFGASSYSYNNDYVPDSLKTVIITGGTDIGSYAFYNCSNITSITIPDSVTSIGKSAFYGCSNLESITLPFVGNTLNGTSNTHFGYIFGASSYYYNDDYVPSSLKTVVITCATSIGEDAFYECYGLTSITIPDSVTSIGNYAFRDCSGLTSINYCGTEAQWGGIYKGYKWNYNIGKYSITFNYKE